MRLTMTKNKTTFPVKSIIDGVPTFEMPIEDIALLCQRGGAIKILTESERITDSQRAWYKGIALPFLAKNDENQETVGWWDMEVKKLCNGLALLKKEIFFLSDGQGIGRLTTKGVGVNKMRMFITEIIAKSVEKGWGLAAPDSELSTKPKRLKEKK